MQHNAILNLSEWKPGPLSWSAGPAFCVGLRALCGTYFRVIGGKGNGENVLCAES